MPQASSAKAGALPATPGDAASGTITSRDNKWLKLFRSVLQGTGPAAQDPIGVEGPKLVEEAVRSGLEADAILVSAKGEHYLPAMPQAASESEAGIRRERILKTTDALFAR